MRMNRRNVLAGIGTTVVAGGAALGSGAFSQVEADRTVSVTTAGDGSALLAFDVDDTYNGVSDSTDDTIALNFEDINQDAITTFDGALTVTNNGSEQVSLSVDTTPAAVTFDATNGDLSQNAVDIPAGTSETIDVEIDLVNNAEPADAEITFVAETA